MFHGLQSKRVGRWIHFGGDCLSMGLSIQEALFEGAFVGKMGMTCLYLILVACPCLFGNDGDDMPCLRTDGEWYAFNFVSVPV